MKLTSELKAICKDCWDWGEGFYTDASEAGDPCPSDHDDWPKVHKLVKRTLWICPNQGHYDGIGFLSRGDLVLHMEEDAEYQEMDDEVHTTTE